MIPIGSKTWGELPSMVVIGLRGKFGNFYAALRTIGCRWPSQRTSCKQIHLGACGSSYKRPDTVIEPLPRRGVRLDFHKPQ